MRMCLVRHFASFAAALLLLALAPTSFAEKRSAGAKGTAVEILHVAPAPKQLPAPGEMMKLLVTLKNTKDSERRLRAFIVRDGQMLDISVPTAQFNQEEMPYYEVPLYAPEGEMLYLFMLYNPDGSVTSSNRYFVRRLCLPNTTLASGKVDPSLPPDQRLIQLASQVADLNRDIKSYEMVLSLLKDLQKLIGDN